MTRGTNHALPDRAPACSVAVILPCHDEGPAIASVVEGFKDGLPGAVVYVYDNASSDDTAARAVSAGAVLRREEARGKGNVVRRAFADVEADVYVLADGDGTYDPASVGDMIRMLIDQQLDMVTGVRASVAERAYRPGHRTGNALFSWVFRRFFGLHMTDVLSGYRVFSRRFVKSFPSVARGFEIEVEMSAHAARMRLPVGERITAYGVRGEGSVSKLSTWRDGLRISWRMLMFLHAHRPFFIYANLAALLAVVSLILGFSVGVEFLKTGLVPRLPTAVLAASGMVAAIVVLTLGILLHMLARYHTEAKRLTYLSIPSAHPQVNHADTDR